MNRCEKCGKKHDGNYGSGRFCNSKCANSRNHKNKKKKIACILCRKIIEVNITYPNKFVKCENCKPQKVKKKKVIRYCFNCGKKLKKQKKFCNSICVKRFYFCKNVNLWLAGEKDGLKSKFGSTSGWIKKYIIEIHGKKCSICGIEKWMGKNVPLILDHIDGHYQNNNIDNLRLVCGNCDMQLSTYKSKNIGNGRPRPY